MELSTGNQYEMTHGARRHTRTIIRMFSCHLKMQNEVCQDIYSEKECSITEMTHCLSKKQGETPLEACVNQFDDWIGRQVYSPQTWQISTLTAKNSATLCLTETLCMPKMDMKVYIQMNEIKLSWPCDKLS